MTPQQSITEQQQRGHAEANALTAQLHVVQAHQRGHAAVVLVEIEETFPELRTDALQAREQLAQARAAHNEAHAHAQRHATTPPESRAAIDAWVEQGGALDRRVVGLGHLLKQAEDADQRAQAALGQAVERLVQHRRVTAMRESNTRRRAVIAKYQQRWAELNAWHDDELKAISAFEAEELEPLNQVVENGLVRGPQTPERDPSFLFKID